ncbi:MAG: hypothetical protein IPM76_13620 [Chloroflexi bacterium]|nr:hypothetical protein [Chloroflexota bacterium]
MPDDIRIEYHPNLYVPREKAESEVQKWLTGNGRLLTITSPPATGKSWLLKRVKMEEGFLKNVPSFWLDIRDFLVPATGSLIGSRVIDPNGLEKWLAQFLKEAQETCKNVPAYDAGVETAVLLEKFAEAMQQCHPKQKLYLLVEGGDEPAEAIWNAIERQILEPIARLANWRFIIVLRHEQRLISYMLRRDEQRLVLGALPKISNKGKEQLELLRQEAQNPHLPDTDTILTILPDYPWSHPGLNHFLFLEVKANYRLPRANWLNHDYCLRGLCAITQLPLDHVNGMYTYLRQIVNQLNADWTPDELMANFDLPVSKAWERIETLKSAWLVENVARNRFKIPDGVREFVQ